MGLIRTTFEIITPESSEGGDAEERGFIDEEGTEYNVEEAVKLIEGCEPSSSAFHHGIWYSLFDFNFDYHTGNTETRSYHLVEGTWTAEEEQEIYERAHNSQ